MTAKPRKIEFVRIPDSSVAIDMSKIMKRRGAITLVGLETMKELEFWNNFLLTLGSACLHECLTAI